LHEVSLLSDQQKLQSRTKFRWQLKKSKVAGRRQVMIYTLAVVLLVMWLLGWVSDLTTGGSIHLLLLIALILIAAQMIQGKRQGKKNLKR
jgi:hypothetical protein